MLIEAVIVLSVLFTSVLSGVLGMAGGMILMAILVSVISVSAAMMVHGAVQATANGSRAWFLRKHVQWRILPAYVVGATLTFAVFAWLSVVPDANLILLLVGLFPWLARMLPKLPRLNVCHKPTTVACGAVVTAAQLLAGASGPLLDVFYLNAPLDRYQIIASKAVTQTLGHIAKLVYYGVIIGVTDGIPAWFYAVAMLTAVSGTRIGTRLLTRLSDEGFRRVSSYVILTIATVCLVKGALGLLLPMGMGP